MLANAQLQKLGQLTNRQTLQRLLANQHPSIHSFSHCSTEVTLLPCTPVDTCQQNAQHPKLSSIVMAFPDILTSSPTNTHRSSSTSWPPAPVTENTSVQHVPGCHHHLARQWRATGDIRHQTADQHQHRQTCRIYRICLHDAREEGRHSLHCSCHDTTARFIISLVRDDAAVQKEIASDVTDCALLASAGAIIPPC